MAVSNKFGSMVVTTGNKSEVSVGYATLYGDMNGGYNPIKDIYKTEVFKLARWRNGHVPETGMGPAGVVIPETIIEKPPSAELRPDQKDEDSLPPYDALDDILFCLVEDEWAWMKLSPAGMQRMSCAASNICYMCPNINAVSRARCQNRCPQFRARPALSDYQRVSRRVDALTLIKKVALKCPSERASPPANGIAACWQCPRRFILFSVCQET